MFGEFQIDKTNIYLSILVRILTNLKSIMIFISVKPRKAPKSHNINSEKKNKFYLYYRLLKVYLYLWEQR